MPGTGAMDREITLQQKVTDQDDQWDPAKPTWKDVHKVFAQVIPTRQNERFEANRDLATRTAKFIIWYSHQVEDVDETWRISYDGIWDIIGIAEVGRKVKLEVTAERRQ